jgi:2-C-methyl-D-erythritol 2,4-cyclodiphosphate synthase
MAGGFVPIAHAPQRGHLGPAAVLREAAARVRAAGFEIGNIDSTVVAQAPKLAPHIDAMRRNIAQAVGVDLACVNVKAKTAEKMGPVGEGRAMEARAVALISRVG